MKYTMNVCDFCAGLFSECESVCSLPNCPLASNMELYSDAENNFGGFLEVQSSFIKSEMMKGNIKPGEDIEIQYKIVAKQ